MTRVTDPDTTSVPWWRRPRPPERGVLAVRYSALNGVSGRVAMYLLLGMALAWGLGASMLDWPWWARAIGITVAVLSGVGIVALTVHLLRPVSDTVILDTDDDEAAALARHGRVELGVSPARATGYIGFASVIVVAGVLMAVFGGDLMTRGLGVLCAGILLVLGLLPHLEFATGRGPGLTVDAQGIRISRWVPLQIPWSEIVEIEDRHTYGIVLVPTSRFADSYRASRPLLLRINTGGPGRAGGSSYVIPNTLRAHPEALQRWLSYELDQRRSTT
jgi:hypothetical protein